MELHLSRIHIYNTVVQNKNSVAQATLEMQDVLIGQGYAPVSYTHLDVYKRQSKDCDERNFISF